MPTTLRDEIDTITAERVAAERETPGCFWGDGGRTLSPAEAEVFGIAYADFPRMITVWEAWLDFHDLTLGGPVFHSENAIVQERARRPTLDDAYDSDQFIEFATQVGGLTMRQAETMYCKEWFWLAREGNVTYPDEIHAAEANAQPSELHH